MLVALVLTATLTGCGTETRTLTVTKPAVSPVPATSATTPSTTATTSSSTTASSSATLTAVGSADGGGKFESCPPGQQWVVAGQKCIPSISPPSTPANTCAPYIDTEACLVLASGVCPAGYTKAQGTTKVCVGPPTQTTQAAQTAPVDCGPGSYVASANDGQGGCVYVWSSGFRLTSPPGAYLVSSYYDTAGCENFEWSNGGVTHAC